MSWRTRWNEPSSSPTPKISPKTSSPSRSVSSHSKPAPPALISPSTPSAAASPNSPLTNTPPTDRSTARSSTKSNATSSARPSLRTKASKSAPLTSWASTATPLIRRFGTSDSKTPSQARLIDVQAPQRYRPLIPKYCSASALAADESFLHTQQNPCCRSIGSRHAASNPLRAGPYPH